MNENIDVEQLALDYYSNEESAQSEYDHAAIMVELRKLFSDQVCAFVEDYRGMFGLE